MVSTRALALASDIEGKVERRSQGFNYEITLSIATIITSTLYISEGWWGLEFLKKALRKGAFSSRC